MEHKRKILEDFFDCADGPCYFKLLNGVVYKGYLMDVGQDEIEFAIGGPFATDRNISLHIDQSDLDSLSYYDGATKNWIDFKG